MLENLYTNSGKSGKPGVFTGSHKNLNSILVDTEYIFMYNLYIYPIFCWDDDDKFIQKLLYIKI